MSGHLASFKADKLIETVTYRAGNRLLVLVDEGSIHRIEKIVVKLVPIFRMTVLSPVPVDFNAFSSMASAPLEAAVFSDDLIVRGYLGQFTVGGRSDVFDQVLDLLEQPAINSTVAPPGYFRSSDSGRSLADIIAELSEMIGEFDKPKYFYLLPELCASSRRGIAGCSQCIDVCATDAIGIGSESIEVDPFLCQGCGDCSTVCPSGAINYQYPKRDKTLAAIKQMFAKESAVLLLHDATTPVVNDSVHAIEALELEAIGSAGMDIWLGAIAYGAQQVWLLEPKEMTHETRLALETQITQTHSILSSLGYSTNILQLAGVDEFVFDNGGLVVHRAEFVPDTDKRRMIRMSVEHLAGYATSSYEFCELPNGAAFGAIEVDQSACTLCMSCVSVCPEQALLSGGDSLQLKLIESQCVQCGICQRACPENAITLEARYQYDNIAARTPRLLHRESPFQCVECGQPFASRRMIEILLEKLEHHPMFQGEQKRQLMLCEHCKVTAQFVKKR